MSVNVKSILKIIKEAAVLLKNREAAGKVYEKGAADYVTDVDFKVQKYICEQLQNDYPDTKFLGEEADNEEIDFDGQVWVLDPVDGTTNLIHDYRHSAISLALFEKSEVVLGIIYDPYSDELFYAEKGKGAFLNGQQISVSKQEQMSHSLIAIGTSPYYRELAEENFKVFQAIFMACQDIRRSGSAALDLAWVACGRTEGYFERNLKIWDYAAGMLIVSEAGGYVTDYKGESITTEHMSDVVAGNLAISKQLIGDYLNK